MCIGEIPANHLTMHDISPFQCCALIFLTLSSGIENEIAKDNDGAVSCAFLLCIDIVSMPTPANYSLLMTWCINLISSSHFFAPSFYWLPTSILCAIFTVVVVGFFLSRSSFIAYGFWWIGKRTEQKLFPLRIAHDQWIVNMCSSTERAAKSNKIFDFRFEVRDEERACTQRPNNHCRRLYVSPMIHSRFRSAQKTLCSTWFLLHTAHCMKSFYVLFSPLSIASAKLLLLIYEVVCNKNQILNENKCDLMCMCVCSPVACSGALPRRPMSMNANCR